MEIFCIDIETIPGQGLPDGVIPKFNKEQVKVGNIKDKDKIAEKIAIEERSFNNGIIKQMSLHPDLCEVVCFCGVKYDTISGEGEKIIYSGGGPSRDLEVVSKAWEAIKASYYSFIPICSFNGMLFDLVILWHRAIDLQVPVSGRMYKDLTKRYSTQSHYDLMQVLSGWDRQRYESLDFYLKRYGIGGKTGDGSQVYGMWKNGQIKEIEEYCIADVLKTAQLFARLESWIVEGSGVEDA